MDDEKILLVIGNGFDLAHGLKTKYTDFLDFMNDARKKHIAEIVKKNMVQRKKLLSEAEPVQVFQIAEENKKLREQQEELYCQEVKANRKSFDLLKWARNKLDEKIAQNSLELSDVLEYFFKFKHFNEINSTGENWVDFESETENIVQKFENFLLNWKNFTPVGRTTVDSDMSCFVSEAYTDKILIQKDIPDMRWDLKILTLAFEFYLIEEVHKIYDLDRKI